MTEGGLFSWMRKTSFLVVFALWIVSIFVFAILYGLAGFFGHQLTVPGFEGNPFIENLYASVLVATLFGFKQIAGGIVYLYYAQLATTFVLLFVLVDKLVLRWVKTPHHITQEKKIHTVSVMMSIFRDDVDRIRHEFRAKTKHHVDLKEIEAVIDGLYVAFLEVEKLFSVKNEHRHKIKSLHYMMLTENIQHSLHTLDQFITFLEGHKIEWKDKSIEFWLRYILETADKIALNADTSHIKNPKIIIAMENIKEYTEHIEKKL